MWLLIALGIFLVIVLGLGSIVGLIAGRIVGRNRRLGRLSLGGAGGSLLGAAGAFVLMTIPFIGELACTPGFHGPPGTTPFGLGLLLAFMGIGAFVFAILASKPKPVIDESGPETDDDGPSAA